MLSVLESAQLICEHSRDVSVSDAGVDSAARYILDACKRKPYTTAQWQENELHPKTNDEAALVCTGARVCACLCVRVCICVYSKGREGGGRARL